MVTLTAAPNLASANATVMFTGQAGSLTHTAPLSLSVVAAPEDFSLTVSPGSQSVDAGDSVSVSLSASGINGFTSQISVQVTGVPTGVSVSPASINLAPGTPQQITFSAASNAASATAAVTFTGQSGSLTQTAPLSLSVVATLTTRTRYVRTDASTEYFGWINDHWIVYNPITNNFYVADPGSNHVMVLNAASETEVGVISVPGAYSIDDTPDHTTLWVGTLVGDVYTVDPVAMTVTNRYLQSQIGPSGFQSNVALLLADGQLALLGGVGGVSLEGSATVFAIWNPTTNSLVESYGCFDAFVIRGLSRTVDRTKLILSDESGDLCEWVEATEQGTYFGLGGFPAINFRLTPDGNHIVVPYNNINVSPGTFANVYDATTLSLVSQIPVTGNTSTGAGFAISADSTTLFVPNDWTIYAYDLATGQPVGWLPNINVPITSGGQAWGPSENPDLQAADGTGLLVGPMEEGVGFIDTTTMYTGAVGSQFPNGYLVPATGPVSGGTSVSITEPAPFGAVSALYVGSQGASNVVGVSGPDTYGDFGSISGTTQSGNTGPVDVYVFTADGGMQLMPEGFSYGPTIIEVTPNMSTGEGGGTGIIYGYGFGPVGNGAEGPLPQLSRAASSTIPPSLQVSIGGNQAQVTGFLPYAYPFQSPPFPLQALAYTIPPGSAPADVTVTSSSGSTTAHAALNYLPAIQQFPLPGSNLAQGIYDPYTDLYYFTDTSLIQVFSKTLGAWQTPISIPAPTGATQRLWGIALSPDGTKLAIADAAAGAIYLLDPATPTSMQTFLVGSEPGGAPIPCGVAVSDIGMVYYVTVGEGVGGGNQFYRLDTTTGQILDYDLEGPDVNGNAYLRTVISSDNKRVFFNSDGLVFYIGASGEKPIYASVDEDCCYGDYDLALSADRTQFAASGYFYDYNLNGESYYGLNDREVLNIEYVYGTKLSPDGTLLFQPSTNGIDVLDGRLGNLLNRVALSVSLSSNYDALVSDGKDNVLIAITGNGDGIAIVDLTSIQEPPALPYEARRNSALNRVTSWRGSLSDSHLQSRSNERSSKLPSLRHRVPHVTKPIFPVSHHDQNAIKPRR
ncbi:MAG: hypothetical protein WAN60_11470 [Candidatus Sulfotelmatobacter sp.]